MSLHVPIRLALCSMIVVSSLGGCAQQGVDDREASLGVVRSYSDEPGTRPREKPAGSGSMPEGPLHLPKGPQSRSDVLWTPKPPGVAIPD